MTNKRKFSWLKNQMLSAALLISAIACCLGTSGCQVSVGGQLLPSAYYMEDDLQYFPKGPEFPLTQEAHRLREASAEALID